MDFPTYKAKTSEANALRDVDVLGSFDFNTATVSLHSLESRHITQMRADLGDHEKVLASGKLSPAQYESLAKVLPLVTHEYTHFVDATSTLWGLNHLRLMNRAYLSDDRRGGKEAEFLHAKRFHDHVRRLRLPRYYTVVNEHVEDTRPWRSDISIGRVFDASGQLSPTPILFGRFSNYRGDLIARSPVSTISLLEASAMAQEIHVQSLLLGSVEPEYGKIEAKQFSAKQIAFLYNRNLTEYSVCVHRVANQQGCTDALLAFRVCAVLIRLALNCPESVFADLAKDLPPGDYSADPEGRQFGEALRDGFRLQDRGAFFYLLSGALPRGAFKNQDSFRQGLDEALRQLGIGLRTFKEQAFKEAGEISTEVLATSIRPIRQLALAGVENMRRISFEEPMISLGGLHLLPAILGDGETLAPFTHTDDMLGTENLEVWFDELYEGRRWVDRFAEACV